MKYYELALGLALMASVGTVWGRPGGNGGMGGGGCGEDIDKFCPDARATGRDAMRECLRAHKDELSDSCRQRIHERMAANSGGDQGDGNKTNYGANTEEGGQMDKRRKALMDAKAAEGPAGDAGGFKAAIGRIARACQNERGLFCDGVEPKGGALMRCLMQHRGEATADCKAALENAKPYAKRRGSGQDDSSADSQDSSPDSEE